MWVISRHLFFNFTTARFAREIWKMCLFVFIMSYLTLYFNLSLIFEYMIYLEEINQWRVKNMQSNYLITTSDQTCYTVQELLNTPYTIHGPTIFMGNVTSAWVLNCFYSSLCRYRGWFLITLRPVWHSFRK